ncbi:hypothetical protein [Amycolatopsis palatopharyngis]|nr:hypothetical protein [Amycolatopsis palatopharyngis]
MHGHDDLENTDPLWIEFNEVLEAELESELSSLIPSQRLSAENIRE